MLKSAARLLLIPQKAVTLPSNRQQKTTKTMNIGDRAPEVLGKDEQGRDIRLSDYKGRKLTRRTIQAAVRLRLAACATGTTSCKEQAMRW